MLSDVYFPRVNGVSTSIHTFSSELTGKGHDITLVAPGYDTETSQPFEVIRIPSHRILFDKEDRLLSSRVLNRQTAMLAERKFDLIHIQTPFAAHYAGVKFARKWAIPVVESYHTFFEEYLDKYIPLPRKWLRFAARHFSRSQCNDVDHLIVPSHPMHDVLTQYGITTSADIIPTGIDGNQFRQGDGHRFRAKHGISDQRPTLLHIGRIAHEKNIDFLLRTLSHIKRDIPDILLVIAGEGPARTSLEKLAESLGLIANVKFVGYLGRAGELQDCYAAGDLFIFSSRTETQGLVLLESMALGTPVVSTAIMGTKEMLIEGEGALIADEDEKDFSHKVVKVMRDHTLRETLSKRARKYAAQWTSTEMADRLIATYQRLIE